MYNNDSNSLNAGAPDLRLTGNQQMASAPDPTAEMNDFSMQVFGKPLHQLTPPQLDALYELMNEQSKAPQQDSGIMAAAPGTYTQNRKRQMAAGGGIMGSNNGSMLVAPTADGSRPGYGFLSDLKDKFVDDIIPNEIKENPVATAALLGLGANQFDLIPGEMSSQNWLGDLLGGRDAVLGPGGSGDPLIDFSKLMPGGSYPESDNTTSNVLQDLATNYLMNTFAPGQGSSPYGLNTLLNPMSNYGLGNIFGTGSGDQPTGSLPYGLSGFGLGNINLDPYLKQVVKERMDPVPATQGRFVQTGRPDENIYVPGTAAIPGSPEESRRSVNPLYPIAAGIGVGKYVSGLPKDELPMDTTSIDPAAIAAAARGTDAQGAAAGLRFLPEQVTRAAQGGRIGYAGGGDEGFSGVHRARRIWGNLPNDIQGKYKGFHDFFMGGDWEGVNMAQGGRIGYADGTGSRNKMSALMFKLSNGTITGEEMIELRNLQSSSGFSSANKAQGGRIGAEKGGLMNLGGMEKDYRNEGGFVALGGEEKADDVPARLSKNEFVFTADAVRGAGGGDIDQGAEIMENMMKHLESGGEVSEDSQGLEGARGMFANAQKLQNRIV